VDLGSWFAGGILRSSTNCTSGSMLGFVMGSRPWFLGSRLTTIRAGQTLLGIVTELRRIPSFRGHSIALYAVLREIRCFPGAQRMVQ
jgi:hypothetical protein